MKTKKLLSILLAIAMVFSVMPSFAVFAEDEIELNALTSYFNLEFDGNDTATNYHWAYDNDLVTPITLTPETDGTVKLTGEIFANTSGVARQPVIVFDTPISVSGKTDTVLEVRMKIDAAKDNASNNTLNFGKQILTMVKNGNYHADAWIVSGKLGYGGGEQNAASKRAVSTDYEIKDNAWYTYYVHLNTASKKTKTDVVGDDGTSFTGGTDAAMSYNGTVDTINYLYFPFSENVITTVDYVKVYDATTLPTPVVSYDGDVLDGATNLPLTFDAAVTFENAITENQMSLISVDNDATVTKALSEDGKTVTLSFNGLTDTSAYTVSAPIMAGNNAFSATFSTQAVIPDWYLVKLDFEGADPNYGTWKTDNGNAYTLALNGDGTTSFTGTGGRSPRLVLSEAPDLTGVSNVVVESRMKITGSNRRGILFVGSMGINNAGFKVVDGELKYGNGSLNDKDDMTSTGYMMPLNTWFTVKMNIDLVNSKQQITIVPEDGSEPFIGPVRGGTYNVAINSLANIQFAYTGFCTQTVDYFYMYNPDAIPTPEIAYNGVALDGATGLEKTFDAIINFENEITQEEAEKITVDNNANFTVALSDDKKSVILSFDGLMASTNYTVSVPMTKFNGPATASFSTVVEIPEWYLLKLDFEGADAEYGSWGTDSNAAYTLVLNNDGTTSFANTGGRAAQLNLTSPLATADLDKYVIEARMKLGSNSGNRPVFLIGDMANVNAGLKTTTENELAYGNGSRNDNADMDLTGYTIPANVWVKVKIEIDNTVNKQKVTIIPEDGSAAYYGGNRGYTYNVNSTLAISAIRFAFMPQVAQTLDYFYIYDPAKQPAPAVTYNGEALDGAKGLPETFDATVTFTEPVTQADIDKITVDNDAVITKTLADDGLSATLSFADLKPRTTYAISIPEIGVHTATTTAFTTNDASWYIFRAEFDEQDNTNAYTLSDANNTITDGILNLPGTGGGTVTRVNSVSTIDLSGREDLVFETRVKFTMKTANATNTVSSGKILFALLGDEGTLNSGFSLWSTDGYLGYGGNGDNSGKGTKTDYLLTDGMWYTVRMEFAAGSNTPKLIVTPDEGEGITIDNAAMSSNGVSKIYGIRYSYRYQVASNVDYIRIWDADLLPTAKATLGETDLNDVRRAVNGDEVTITFPTAITEAELDGKVKLNGEAVDVVLASDGLSATFTLSNLTERTVYTLTIDAPTELISGKEYVFRSADAPKYLLNAQFDGNDDDSAFFRQYTDRTVTPAVTKYANFTNTHSWINNGVLHNNFTDQYISFRFDNNEYVKSGLGDLENVIIQAKVKIEPGETGSTVRKEFFRVGNIGMIGAYDADGDGMKELTYGESGSSKGTPFSLYGEDFELENGEWYLLTFTLNFKDQTYTTSLEKEGSGNPTQSGVMSMNTTFTKDRKYGIPHITTAYYAGKAYANIYFDYLTIENTQYGKAEVTFNDGAKLEHTAVMPVRDNIIDVTLVKDATTTEGIAITDIYGNSVDFQAVVNGNVISIVPADFEYDTTYILNLPKEVLGSESDQKVEFATIYDEAATFVYPAGFEADKFSADNKLNVVYFGGSITAQNGWRVKSTEWFQSKYGAENVNAVNASYGGTGTGYGYYRLGRDVAIQNPDIVFVEFSVNDATNLSRGKTMESIVRGLQSLEKPPVIIFVHTMTQDIARNIGAVEEFDAIARHYGIPVINIHDYVQGMYRTDSSFADKWDTLGADGYITTDGTHPNANGDALYGGYVNAVMEANSAKYFKYSKSASAINGGTDFVYNYKNVDDENLTAVGDTYTTTITGDKFIFDIVRSKSSGKFSVTVDGVVKIASIDAYNTSSTPMPTYSVTGLGDGEHTVVFTVLEDKNASSTGNNVNIKSIFTVPDAYEINFEKPVFDANEVVVGTPLTATVYYNTEKATDFSLIIVLYDVNGNITAMNATTSTTDTSNEVKSASVFLTPVTGDVKAKAFIWDALTGLQPFAPNASIGFN